MIERAEVVSPAEARVLSLAEEFSSAWQRTLDLAVRLGASLYVLKSELGHGNWLPWVEANFPLGERMSQNLIALARNPHFIADLPPETTVTAALKWISQKRAEDLGPKELPEHRSAEASPEPLLRYMVDCTTADIVANILRVCFPDARTALDMTYGSGAFWNGSAAVAVTAVDLNPARALHGVEDFRNLSFAGNWFDVALFDPPHLADAGAESVMGERFGTYPEREMVDVVMKGTSEAWRVAKLGIVVKVTDHVHGQEYVCESDWVRDELDEWPLYESVHQVRSNALIDPKWGQPQLSAYSNGSTFLIFRKDRQGHTR